MPTSTGAQLLVRMLKAEGVRHVFTLSGLHVAPIYAACVEEGIAVVDTRHEQAAAHAADATARLTRGIGVCCVTAGPGVTDALTGIANAWAASSPVLLLGGAAPTFNAGRGSLQEMEQVDLFTRITKWSDRIPAPDRGPTYPARAFRTMRSGRPGPVFLEVPWDVLSNGADDEEAKLPTGYRTRARVQSDPGFVSRAARLLERAERPAIIAGSSIWWDDAPEALAQLADRTGAPVYLNGAGRGALPPDHPNFFTYTRKDALDVARAAGDPMFVADGGNWVAIAAKVIRLQKPGRWLDPGPLGCLGVGAPFALAGKLLHPSRPIFVIQGDGSFGLNGMDFETAVRFDLPMVCVVGNDASWGQIRLPQLEFFGPEKSPATLLAPTRYDTVVEALGGYGEHVEDPAQIRPALERAVASATVACVNVMLDPEAPATSGAQGYAI